MNSEKYFTCTILYCLRFKIIMKHITLTMISYQIYIDIIETISCIINDIS